MQVLGVTCFGVVMNVLGETEQRQVIIYILRIYDIMVSKDNHDA